jgi:DNA-binding transcriptional regulator YdaS (Cro superfamily)
MVASRLANLGLGKSKTTAAAHGVAGITRQEAAEKLNVSTTLVSQASTIAREAPEKVAEIEAGKTTISKVTKELKAAVPKEKATSAFAQAVIDGTYTGKAFRKEVGNLSKLIDQCKITIPLVEYVSAISLLKTLENFIAFSKGMSRTIPVKDLEKRVVALQTERDELCAEIDDVLTFGSATFHQMYEVLENQAASDEENGLLATVKEQFNDRWKQVLEDLKMTEKVSFEYMEAAPKKESAKAFVADRRAKITPKK